MGAPVGTRVEIRCQECQQGILGAVVVKADSSVFEPAGECDRDHLFLADGGMVARCPHCGRLVELVADG